MDELQRAIFGFLWAWPAIAACQHLGFKAFAVSLLVTAWMIPGWAIYAGVMGK